ncbi:MAG: DUF357 domain-containing protein [Candidatus Aenigmatarchaeota archaeon]
MEIREETEKMIEKIKPLIDKIEIKDKKGEEMLENMKAYIADSQHFLKNKNYLKAFEAIVWAFAILEICEDLGIFNAKR